MRRFIPGFVFSIYHFLLALLGAIIYGFPSKKLIVIGVTGTNGKSTVVYLITEILEKSGFNTASISSIRFKIRDKKWKNTLKMTMPGRFKLQKFLRQVVGAGCKYVVLEVTSEGIKQHRHRFIGFNAVVFTNLTKEHIEAHKGFENYKKAKGKLFKTLKKSKKKDKFIVINADDEYGEYYTKLAGNVKKYFYGIKNEKAEITPDKIKLQTSLPGEFNIYNCLAAICVGLSQKIPLEKILKVVRDFKGVPGRMESVIDNPFKVIIDYAHTPDSLIKVYQTIRKSEIRNPKSEMICVLGSCGGGRDKWKRPELGRIASQYCNKIILTNEDPYDENPAAIIEDIAAGFSEFRISNFEFRNILDRRKAIREALSLARKDDIVITTGKGSEPWICVEKGRKIAWNEAKIVREEFEKVYGKQRLQNS